MPTVPVSYTHLDVYKRQGDERMNKKALLVLSIGMILISVGACAAHETSERLNKEPEPSVVEESLPEKDGNADIPSAPDPQPKGSRQVKKIGRAHV